MVSGDKAKDERGVYQTYYDYREKLNAIPPHRLLALDTGVRDGRIKRGELLLLEAFGGGFTWGSALIRF